MSTTKPARINMAESSADFVSIGWTWLRDEGGNEWQAMLFVRREDVSPATVEQLRERLAVLLKMQMKRMDGEVSAERKSKEQECDAAAGESTDGTPNRGADDRG